MNRNAVSGLLLVIMAGVFACLVASLDGGVVESLFGKAVWYVPYVAFVGGVRKLVRARG